MHEENVLSRGNKLGDSPTRSPQFESIDRGPCKEDGFNGDPFKLKLIKICINQLESFEETYGCPPVFVSNRAKHQSKYGIDESLLSRLNGDCTQKSRSLMNLRYCSFRSF